MFKRIAIVSIVTLGVLLLTTTKVAAKQQEVRWWKCPVMTQCYTYPKSVCKKCTKQNPRMVIRLVFGSSYKKATSVAWCESKYYTKAKNGQHRGVFQMNTSARRRYSGGHYSGLWNQVKAAKRMYDKEGWSPWSQCL